MEAWEIFGDDLLWVEVYAGIALLVAVALWSALPRIPVKLIVLCITVGVLAYGAFRPFNYNSDTRNYYSYVYVLRFVSGNEIFFLTKLEPVHSFLIFLLGEFRRWLMVEAALEITGLLLAYRKRPNDASFLTLCAFVLTLSTSSMRFCSAIIWFYYFLVRSEITPVRAARMTIILTGFHISMLMSGVMALRHRLMPFVIIGLCFLVFFQSSLILGGRLDIDLTEATRGLKTLAVAVVPIAYLMMRLRLEEWLEIALYLVALLALYVVSATVLFTFNRFLILGSLVVLAQFWQQVRGEQNDIFDRLVVTLICAGILVPHVITLPDLYFSRQW